MPVGLKGLEFVTCNISVVAVDSRGSYSKFESFYLKPRYKFSVDNLPDSSSFNVYYGIAKEHTVYYLLFIIYYLLFIIYYLLFIIYYLLFIIYYLLFIIYYLLFIIYYLLFIIYYLFLVSNKL